MFSEYRDLISELKVKDSHFKKMFDKHNDLDEEIKKLDKNYADDLTLSKMKKEKLKIKD